MPQHSPPFDPWLWWQACQQTWLAGLDPLHMGRHLRQQRLGRLLHAALHGSPLYARRARNARALADFEPIGKQELMHHFDDWATDRRITHSAADAALRCGGPADPWLDRYLLWTSSGSSGQPGIFVQDAAALAAFDALEALRLRGGGLSAPSLDLWAWGRRIAYVGAIGGPYAGHVALRRLQRLMPAPWAPQLHVLSVLEPLPQIAQQLQSLQPDVLITYPSFATALASQQARGKPPWPLRELWLGGEQLSSAQRALLKDRLCCTLRNSYGASEFYSIAYECAQGRLHLNDDWVILEGIDAQGRAVAQGEFSHTTLLTNLANQVQPLLRYELTDRVRFVPGACPCGCALPVIEVQGRCDDVLTLPGLHGGPQMMLPLVLEEVLEEDAGVTQFQLLRRPGGTLELRLPANDRDLGPVFERCCRALQDYFSTQGVAHQHIVLGTQAPVREPGGGKLRRVIDLGAVP